MKTLIFKTAIILMVSGIAVNANATNHNLNVPNAVTTAFKNDHPQASVKKWELTPNGYRAAYKADHKTYAATYAADGTWVRSSQIINWRNTPKQIKAALRTGKYAAYYTDEIKQVNSKEGKIYVLTIDNHNGSTMPTEGYGDWEDYQLTYNNAGNLINAKEL